MTQVTQQQPVLNFNDKEYVINELSPECQSCLVYMQEIDEKIQELKATHGLTVLMAEQNFNQAIKIADRGYVMVQGQVAFEGASASDLQDNEFVKQVYLGA